jgi:acyl-CoA thioesterase II
MGDLERDTTLTEIPGGGLAGNVIADWDGFRPNGGFLAAMSLRAAATCARIRAPRSLQCQFLRGARHGDIAYTPAVVGQSSRSDVIQVTAAQNGSPVLVSLTRTLLETEMGAAHVIARAPDVPDPDFLRPTEELLPPELLHILPLTRNFEVRPVTWERTWPPPKGRNPAYLAWCRFRPAATFGDPFVGVGRYLILLDSYVWAAVERGTAGAVGLSAVTTDLSVTIDDRDQSAEWLLVDVVVPVMCGGSISAQGTVWSRDGTRLASGVINMACLPQG